MDTNMLAENPNIQSKQIEMMSAQNQALMDLVSIQRNQQGQIEELKQQNERLIGLLAKASEESRNRGFTHVKIEDVNMPFGAMVGFLVKVSLASIPAFLVLAIVYFAIVFVLGLAGVIAGGVLSNF